MSLGYPNEEGGRASQSGFFHAFGSIFNGYSISGFRVRQNSPLGMSVRFGGETDVDDSLFLKDNDGGTYPVFNPDKQPIIATVTPANASNPRVDAAIIYIDNTEDASQDVYDNANKVKAVVIPGTPATSPSAPNNSQILAVIGANSWYKVMAEIDVPAGTVTSITDAMIVDRRVAVVLRADTVDVGALTLSVLDFVYPIGIVIENALNPNNPATYLGFGTWVAYSPGRVTVGFDATQTEFNEVGKTGGEKTHTLTSGEMPSHNHGFTTYSVGTGNGNHIAAAAGSAVSGPGTNDSSVNAGGDGAHNNLQPYKTVYKWERTA